MLTEEQARQIVLDSIGPKAKSAPDSTLVTALEVNLDSLAIRLASDATTGVSRVEHHIDLNALLVSLHSSILTVGDLTGTVMRLSSGKLCSNPRNPHPQPYPYPKRCPQCKAPVE
jgi:hypothetical protein